MERFRFSPNTSPGRIGLRKRRTDPEELQVTRELNLTLQVWRQDGSNDPGHFETYAANGISEDMSFLEMLDIINEDLIENDLVPIEFDHDCREGICGTCSLMINGQAHGQEKATTTCQLHMRKFNDGDTIVVEPFRARAFPVVRDLVVDRSSFDRIIEAGGYISVNTGAASDANLTPVPKEAADTSFDAAACIGCGACVAACPNSAAQLFTSAKLAHLNLIPQGQPQRFERTETMVETMETFFGSCTNHGECHEACPKEISLDFIAFMNRDYVKAKVKNRKLAGQT
ncbi:MAG TPA: succinate dehydrogenase/fumarate reductase iron-sulfur subunit [Acidimicrobiaceae bacterium]|nr:succinate dehydrogenase/fumarate reductase iron-sulfur subunit [Acidimicrobiaceae bacterium]